MPISHDQLKHSLDCSPVLQQILYQDGLYICLKDRQEIITTRQKRERISCDLWASAIKYGQLLSHIPFVEMVALTGALAVRNPSSEQDDFDYLLVTRPKRVWLARLFAIVIVRIVRLSGRELCPNYVLASDQLEQSRQDLYMAHEVAQMVPIYGDDLYHKLSQQNRWVTHYLPNALPNHTVNDTPRRIRRFIEKLLGGTIGDMLENWEYRRKLDKFKPKVYSETSSAEINESSVKGHFDDHGLPVMARYQELLEMYGLLDSCDRLAGD